MSRIGLRMGLLALLLSSSCLTGCQSGGNAAASSAAAPRTTTKSLYERLGGAAAIAAVVDEFVARAAADPRVDFTRGGKWQATDENVARLKKHLVDFIGSATGGPQKYTGRDMKTAHRGMGITRQQFEAIAGDLKAALDKFNVDPADASELLGKVAGTLGDIVGQ